MKKIKLLLFIVLIIIFTLPSCKKGENDPFLSLRSRKARITGIWNLTSGTRVYCFYDTTLTETYNEVAVDVNFSTNSAGTFFSESFSYREYWEINKDYTFKMFQNYYDYNIEISGYWNFNHKDENLNLKNKESILFRVLSKKYIYNNVMYNRAYRYSGSFGPVYQFNINQLKNNEIKVGYEGSAIDSTVWSKINVSEVINFTFKQK